MSSIDDKIQQLKNLSGIFTGAGGDRIPPHGTTHTKNGEDPVPQEIDGVPVDLNGMTTGEGIVLDASGNLVPGSVSGALVSLQTAYDNGGSVTLDGTDFTIQLGNSKKLVLKDKDGNTAYTFEDVGADNRLTLAPDILKLKDSNVTTAIDFSSVGNVELTTTDKSVVGAINELQALLASYPSPANLYDKVNDNSSDILIAPLSGGTGTGNAQLYFDYASGFMLCSWGGVTDNGDGTIDIAEGCVWASKSSAAGSPKDFFTLPARTNVPLDDNGGLGASNYICADTSGTPQWVVTTNITPYLPPNESGRFVDSVFLESDGEVHVTGLENLQISHHSSFAIRDFDFALGKGGSGKVLHARGAIMGTTGTRHMSISEGRFWNAYQRITTNAFDTNVSGTVRRYYTADSGTTWTKDNVTQLSNTQYNDITSGLVSMNTGRFKVCWMFLDSQGDVYVESEGQNQYTSLALAEAEPFPTIVPLFISAYCEPVGRYIVQQGSDTVVTQSAFTADLQLGATNDHNFLANRDGDASFLHHKGSLTAAGSSTLAVSDGTITGSTATWKIEQRDLENFRTFIDSDNDRYVAVSPSGRYVVVSEDSGPDDIVLYDFNGGGLTEIARTTNNVGAVEFVDDTEMAILSSGNLSYYRVPDLTLNNSVSITTTALCDIIVGKTTGKLYTARGTNILYRHNLDGTADADTGALPSMTNVICACLLSDDENTLYVLDAASGGASGVILRVYDVTTFNTPTLTGSVTLTSTVNGEVYSKIGLIDGLLYIAYTAGGSVFAKKINVVNISAPATPTIAFLSGASTVNSSGCYFKDGQLWRANDGVSDLLIDRLPMMYAKLRGNIDANLVDGSWQADGANDANGDKIILSSQQLIKGAYYGTRPYVQTDREVSASTTVELYDRGNIIFVDGLSASATIDIDSAVLAIDGFEFAIMVDYDATYNVDLVYTAATNWWRCPGSASSTGPLCYKFVIKNSKPIPCGLMPTWV